MPKERPEKQQGEIPMSNRYALDDWLMEADTPALGGQPDPSAGGSPATSPAGNMGPPPEQGMPPNVANQPGQDDQSPDAKEQEPPDVSQDPQGPDMPEPPDEGDFEQFKKQYFKESIKGDAQKLIDMLKQIRESDRHLLPYQHKFVEDNLNIQTLRLNANIDKASKEIRKLIKEQLDRNNPAVSVVNHLCQVLETVPLLNNIFVKLNGYEGMKGDLHRKFVAALLGAVQVGNGADKADIVFNDKDYSIMISTRFNAKWGRVFIGDWSLREDDPERYLKEPEIKRLGEGSPEEKDVLRRRVVAESIADKFNQRAYVVHTVDDDGTIYVLGYDIATSLRTAYANGKLVVRTRHSDNSEAMITDDGEIIPFVDLNIYYVKETGQQDEDGMPEKEEVEFMQRRDGMLFLTAALPTLKEAASSMGTGIVFKEVPYGGNPSDLKTLKRCVYTTHDMLMKVC